MIIDSPNHFVLLPPQLYFLVSHPKYMQMDHPRPSVFFPDQSINLDLLGYGNRPNKKLINQHRF